MTVPGATPNLLAVGLIPLPAATHALVQIWSRTAARHFWAADGFSSSQRLCLTDADRTGKPRAAERVYNVQHGERRAATGIYPLSSEKAARHHDREGFQAGGADPEPFGRANGRRAENCYLIDAIEMSDDGL